jgi:hypothetical protein
VLPDYVIDQPDEIPPVVLPEPEPEPDLSGPLPEFVIEPAPAEAAPVPRLEPVATAEEESLGPLPDYVIDPDDPRAARKHAPPAPPPEPTPILMPRPVAQEEPRESPALNFPSAGAVSIPRKDQTDAEPHEARAARPRPPAESDAPSHEPASAEPGDEGSGEVGWMAGLSNRLSAYSLAEDEERAARPDDDTVDDA